MMSGLSAARQLDRLHAVQRLDHIVAEVPKHRRVDDPVVLVVLDEEYGLADWSRWFHEITEWGDDVL